MKEKQAIKNLIGEKNVSGINEDKNDQKNKKDQENQNKKNENVIKEGNETTKNLSFYEQEQLKFSINYNFPNKYKSNGTLIEFYIFNRYIMDFVVETNTQYLVKMGFIMKTQGQLEHIQTNMGILESIKIQTQDKGSFFNRHLSLLRKCVENEITEYIHFVMQLMIKELKLKKIKSTLEDIDLIQKKVQKKKK
eukprot:Anaeramoba_flamelloidesa808950_20.p1 GENE.a808950_20~~a808950_20.p1  ORF type:complete len:193 (-),score=52.63 a808950_20:9-587(-)